MQLIDVGEALMRVTDAPVCSMDSLATKAFIYAAIKTLPTIDAEPVVHGRWIDIPDKPEWDQKQCSICGDIRCCQGNYCPNCGAIMD